MSTVKISQLPLLTSLNANTANSLFVGVDIPTNITGKFTAHTLAQGLYSHEILNVGLNHQNLPNTIAQFALDGDSYIQTNLVNTNDGGTADIVVTANTGSGGSDSTNFIDMGWANKNYQPGSEFNNIGNAVQPNDGYLYVQGTSGQKYGNLIIGSTSTSGQLKFIAGGGQASNVVAKITSTGLTLNTQSYLTFADGSIQSVAAAPANYTQSAFDVANTATGNTIVNQGINTSQNTRINSIETINSNQNTAISIIQGVDLTQNTNITFVDSKAQGAFDLANTTNTRQNISTVINGEQNTRIQQLESNSVTLFGYTTQSGVINAGQNTSINLALSTANTALALANAALANTTVTLNGDLTTTGNIITEFVRSTYTSLGDFTPLATFTASNSGAILIPSSPGYIVQVTGKDGSSARIALDAIGTVAVPNYLTRHARGAANTPTPTQSGDVLGRYSSFGYGNTVFNAAADARIDITALENFTDTAHGTSVTILATPIGTNTAVRVINASSGNTSLLSSNTYISGNTTIAGNLNVASTIYAANGIINKSNTYTRTQTAITINMATEMMVRATVGAALTITPTGFGAGLEAEVIITNPNTGGGATRTITHGCSAINSSVGATTFNLGGTATAFVKYYCFNNDLANTYVKISFS